MTGHALYLRERTEAILSTARMSPEARARAMGKHHYQPVAKEHRISVDIKAATRTVKTTDPAKVAVEKAVSIAPIVTHPKRSYMHSEHADIFDAVAQAWGITIFSLLSAARSQRASRPRFAVAMLLRNRGLPLTRIGSVIRRDHTSVINAIKRATDLLENDPKWATLYRTAERALTK